MQMLFLTLLSFKKVKLISGKVAHTLYMHQLVIMRMKQLKKFIKK